MKHDTQILGVTKTTRDIVAGAASMMDAVSAAMRRRTRQLERRRTRSAQPAMPAPVAGLLHGFAHALADKIEAINELLPDDVRERLRAVAPGFTRAALANDPDVVQLFAMLLAATPDELAQWLTEQVELLEERFAS